jgi:CcmD family protein
MGKRSKRLLITVMLMCFTVILFAQVKADTGTTLHDTMRSHNKIYVVMAVCITILLGLILYLVRIDRKISKTERGGPL